MFTFTTNAFLLLRQEGFPIDYLNQLYPYEDQVLTEDNLDKTLAKAITTADERKKWLGTIKLFTRTTFPQIQCSLDPAPACKPWASTYEERRIYAQDDRHELIVYSLHGVKQKEYVLSDRGPESVFQYLVHPAGNKLIVLTGRNLYLVEMPAPR